MSGYPGRGVDAWERSVAAPARLCCCCSNTHPPALPPLPPSFFLFFFFFCLSSLSFSKHYTLIIAKIRQRGCVPGLCAPVSRCVVIRAEILNSLIAHLKLSGRRQRSSKFPVITVKVGSEFRSDCCTHFHPIFFFFLLFQTFLCNLRITHTLPNNPPPFLTNHPILHPRTHTHTHARVPVHSLRPGVMIRCQISFL